MEPGSSAKAEGDLYPAQSQILSLDSESILNPFEKMIVDLQTATGILIEDLSSMMNGDHFNHQY